MFIRWAAIAATLATLWMGGPAGAATVLERAGLVGQTRSQDAQVPGTISFEVTTAGNYIATLRDLNTPVLLESLRAIIVRDFKTVAELELTHSGDPDPAPVTATFAATPGGYQILVIGAAQAEEPGGTFSVSVAPSAGGAPIGGGVDFISAGIGAPEGVSVLETQFEVTEAGSYLLTVSDHAFPAALDPIQAIVLPQAGGSPTVLPMGDTSVSFTAPAGSYDLFVIARSTQPELSGLYSVRLSGGPSAQTVYRSTNPVGSTRPAMDLEFPAADDYELTLADLNFPAALTSFEVALIQDEALLATANGNGASTITAQQGSAQLFSFATSMDIGAFAVTIERAGALIAADVMTAAASAELATPEIYTYSPEQAVAAGRYRLRLHDFRFTSPFAALQALVVQGGTVVDRIGAEGSLDVDLDAAKVKVIVAAQASAGTAAAPGNALFGIALAARPDGEPAGATVFESTQGVGGAFRSYVVPVPAAGPYDLSLADLRFPAQLLTSALAMTRGTDLVAQIYGGGVQPRQPLEQATYVLNLLVQPASGEPYGAYAVKVANSPLPPVVTLMANPPSITSGQRSTLQWSASDATTCMAGDGWTGPRAVSGSEQTPVLSANTTFELSCVGPGGTAGTSTTISVSSPTGTRGGGGSVDFWLLLSMSVLIAARLRSARVRRLSFSACSACSAMEARPART